MHVVLVDNGRSRVLERGYGDALLCIRCSACINECPVYREIGGHAYGKTVYSGPIGAVITPLLADDPLSACELPYASTLCGACRDVCPVKIDLPRLLLDLRGEMTHRGGAPKAERIAMRIFAAAARRPRRFRWAASVARMVTSLLSRRSHETIDALPPPLSAWTKTRAFPRLAPKSFHKLWSERNG
jgi:L-lactate dehydrogenase complex protein LldF